MNINFNSLFDVDIFHEYYKDGISKDFEIFPTEECKKFLKDYRLIFHATPTGFNVSYESDNYDIPIVPIESVIKLTFILSPKNQYILNYSDLPLDKKRNTVYYLTNYYLELSSKNKELQGGECLSENDRIDYKPELFSFQYTSIKKTLNVTVHDIEGYDVINKNIETKDNIANIQIDLRHYSPGIFTLLIDSNEISRFYADDSLTGKTVFGIIEIYLGKSEMEGDDEEDIELAYEISIPCRKTYWKYNVMLKYNSNLHAQDISIDIPESEVGGTYEDGETVYEEMETRVLFKPLDEIKSGNLKCIPFVLMHELPFKEKTIKKIRLVCTKSSGNGEPDIKSTIIQNLTNPSFTSIKPEGSKEDNTYKVYSEVNVYI